MKKPTHIILIMALSIFLMFLYGGCDEAVTPEEDPNTDIPADPSGVVIPTPTKNNVHRNLRRSTLCLCQSAH